MTFKHPIIDSILIQKNIPISEKNNSQGLVIQRVIQSLINLMLKHFIKLPIGLLSKIYGFSFDLKKKQQQFKNDFDRLF